MNNFRGNRYRLRTAIAEVVLLTPNLCLAPLFVADLKPVLILISRASYRTVGPFRKVLRIGIQVSRETELRIGAIGTEQLIALTFL